MHFPRNKLEDNNLTSALFMAACLQQLEKVRIFILSINTRKNCGIMSAVSVMGTDWLKRKSIIPVKLCYQDH